MLPRLLILACLSIAALVGLKLAGASSAWWPALPPEASLCLIAAAWITGSWLVMARLAPRPEEARAPAAAPAGPPAPRRGASPLRGRLERRAHPRFAVDWPVRAAWRDGTTTEGRLRDISRGGACLAAPDPVPAGTEGLLTVEGIALPVPARVINWTATTGLHVAFQLEGLGLETFFLQLDRQVERQASRHTDARAAMPRQ